MTRIAALRREFRRLPPDQHDVWVDRVWDCAEIPADEALPPGCVPYLPCPAASVLEATEVSQLGERDVFVDIGSGLGRAVFVAHLVSGARGLGLELQAHLVAESTRRAAAFPLPQLSFTQGDAGESLEPVEDGTVFFLYCPFGSKRLDRTLEMLQGVARRRPIRICSVGIPVLERSWLRRRPSGPNVSVYDSVRFGL